MGEVGEIIFAVPLTTDHIPDPMPGEFPLRVTVAVDAQVDWLLPASAGDGI